MTRHFWVLAHRYAGLYMAFFLFVAGLTGSVLAFYHELDGWELNPANHQVTVQAKPMLDSFTLREKALALEPHAQINIVNFNRQPGQGYEALLTPATNPATGQPYNLTYQSIHLNPYTGERLVFSQDEGYWSLTRHKILSFIYALHYSLALGEIGSWLFGVAALIWTIDCFIAFYLTLPVRRSALLTAQKPALDNVKGDADARRSFWSRWAIAWRVKWPASIVRLNFDLHRAGGLWSWPMLFVFAWSSVLLNLGTQVYIPVMQQLFEMSDFKAFPIPNLQQPRPEPMIDFKTAYQISHRLMVEQAQHKNFKVLAERSISYDPAKGLYSYAVNSDYDIGETGLSLLWIDGDSGAFVDVFLPTGQKSGDTITLWLQILHMAKIWGLPYKIFVCLMGMVVAMLSGTGVYIWLKKRRSARGKRKSPIS